MGLQYCTKWTKGFSNGMKRVMDHLTTMSTVQRFPFSEGKNLDKGAGDSLENVHNERHMKIVYFLNGRGKL